MGSTLKKTALCLCAGAAVESGSASAFILETSNPDLSVRLDTSVRYNLGVRTTATDAALVNTLGYGNSDSKFNRGDIITNRVDLRPAFNLAYKRALGMRVSAQAWYDHAYRDGKEVLGPRGLAGSAYPGQQYTDYTKRWNHGPSAEVFDAYVYGSFNLGDVATTVRAGQQNVHWGESIVTFTHGVAAGQNPADVRKALATPGLDRDELYKPLTQVFVSARLTDTVTVAGQYLLDWKPVTVTDGGTYWAITDYLGFGGGTHYAGRNWVGVFNKPKDKAGDWGMMSSWSPDWLRGSLGVYYREYTDKIPQIVSNSDFTQMGFDYPGQRLKMWGVSASRTFAGIKIGAELSHRQDTNLLWTRTATVGKEPVGNTWHAVLNAVGNVKKTAVFDSMAWIAELTYSRLDRVTGNAANFNSIDYGCKGLANNLGCSTRDALGIALRIEPKWLQVFEGTDLSMPISFRTGLKGNSVVPFGGYKGNGAFSLGLGALAQKKHQFNLSYNRYFARHRNGIASSGVNAGQYSVLDAGTIGSLWDRGNLAFTYKTNF